MTGDIARAVRHMLTVEAEWEAAKPYLERYEGHPLLDDLERAETEVAREIRDLLRSTQEETR